MARRVLVGSILLSAALSSSSCGREVLVHGQEERSANRIIHLLRSEAGVAASKRVREKRGEPRFDVVVAADDLAAGLAVLERHDLPEPEPLHPVQDGLIPTKVGERMRWVAQLEGDLEQKLRQLPGVVKALAYVALPEPDLMRELDQPDPAPTASVQVLYRADAAGLPPLGEPALRALVAAKIPEIRGENVRIELIPYEDSAPMVARGPSEAACARTRWMGLDVCESARPGLVRALLGSIVLSGVLAAGLLVAGLRALRYRRDLTRLTLERLRA